MKTTAAHFKIFKSTCERTAAKLQLGEWDIRYTHEKLPANVLANCHTDQEARLACIGFAADWGSDEPTRALIERTAKHEVLHVLLSDLYDLVRARVQTSEIMEATEHAIVRRLEKIL